MNSNINNIVLDTELTREEVANVNPGSIKYGDYLAWEEMIKIDNAPWCTQSELALARFVPYGRLRFIETIEENRSKSSDYLEEGEIIRELAKKNSTRNIEKI